ncbi:MAG: hypothetical protein ACPG5Z_00135 [Pseudoalteromonas sp.]
MEVKKLKDETVEKRRQRTLWRKAVKEENNIGKRIVWAAEKLDISFHKISEETGIPNSTLNDRTSGRRTDLPEEMRLLAYYFNELWKLKFHNGRFGYPVFEGEEISAITRDFLDFGHEDKNLKQLKQDYEKIDKINQMLQRDLAIERQANRQLTLFKMESGMK